ncbi:hypothetical protein [Sphingobium yanoikuyae]|uniref:hypothetical protein n=1 Tax=Sphingobium yanoikuyae TaxID=13690 RepID=UPI002FD8EAB6
MHPLEKCFIRNGETGGIADHRINTAFRTHGCAAIIHPIIYPGSREIGAAVKATSHITGFQLLPMISAMNMRLHLDSTLSL